MNKDDRINEFFDVFKQLKINNPGIQLDHSSVYHALTRLGVFSDNKYMLTKDYSSNNIIKKDGLFDMWVNYFNQRKNTFVFVSQYWDYFCQFKHGSVSNNNEFIKIYVPLTRSHIYKGANKIFDFIDRMGIKHTSKIGSDIRIDDIVIRVTNENDANMILNFIKNDNYIQEGLLPPNPFAFNKDGIALACDGKFSYNSTLATLLANFINNNNPYILNSNNFYNYLNNIYESIKNENIDTEHFIFTYFRGKKPNKKDFKRILSLIINSHNPNFTYDNYINHFKDGLITYNDNYNTARLLFDTIKTMNKKYELYLTINALNDYINTGNINKITRLDGLRSKVYNSNLRTNVTNLMKKYNLTFYELCYKVLDEYKEGKKKSMKIQMKKEQECNLELIK